jgi:serine phosphatase RsbU (regulator of sigma subunit)
LSTEIETILEIKSGKTYDFYVTSSIFTKKTPVTYIAINRTLSLFFMLYLKFLNTNFSKPFLVVLTLLCSLQASIAQVPINLTSEQDKYNLSDFAYVLVDDKSEFSIDKIIRPKYSFDFNKDDRGLNYGFSDASYWFKFKAKSEDLESRWLLELSYPVLDTVEFYHLDSEGIWQMTRMGDKQPFYDRPIDYRNFLVPLHFDDNSVQVYYVRVRSSSAVRVPMTIFSEKTSHKDNLEGEILYGIYFGIMFVMIFYNLFIFSALNDVNYLYYVASIVSATLFFSSLSGHSFQYLWFDSTWFANHITPISMGGWAFSSAIFAHSFLNIKKYSKTLNVLLLAIMVGGLIIIILGLVASYAISTRFGVVVLAINCVLMILAGFIAWHKGNRAARFFTIAWLLFLMGVIFLILMTAGILPANSIFEHSPKIGAILEVVILSLALSDRYSILRKEKTELQRQALITQKETNSILERKVQERTKELTFKSKEIEAKNMVLQKQHGEIKQQKDKIESSIRYAKRIQSVMLPPDAKFKEMLPDSFILYKPRDIVSGDFYWIAEVDDKIILAGVDCTGHGVPGAFMSILGSNLLNEIILARKNTNPATILEEMNQGVRNTLNQADSDNQDGMEMAICVIDLENRELEYAGAGMPFIYFEGGKQHIIKADRKAVGGSDMRKTVSYTTHSIPFFEPIECYIFSDGFRDQFGGSNGQKFMMKRFKHLLTDVHSHPIETQQQIITKTFDDWTGQNPQIDDVLLIGFRVE